VSGINFVVLRSQKISGYEDILSSIYFTFSKMLGNYGYSVSDQPKSNCINFVFEEFTNLETSELELFKQTINSETRIVLILSEFMTGRSFNNFDNRFFKSLSINYSRNDIYLKNRFNSFYKFLSNVKFDAFLQLHPSILDIESRQYLPILNRETPSFVFHPYLPVSQSEKKGIDGSFRLELSTKNFNEDFYNLKYPEIEKLWTRSGFEHFVRYGFLEGRQCFSFDFLSLSDFLKYQLDSSLQNEFSSVNLYSSGSSNPFRKSWITTLNTDAQNIDSINFNYKINFVTGWNKFQYSIDELVHNNKIELFKRNFIDIATSQSENWPFLSPIRIWRSFASGLIPIRLGGIVDNISPLKSIVEQVNSIYPVLSLFWAAQNRIYLDELFSKILEYNTLALSKNEPFVFYFKDFLK
jgi:hypothetical protein